VLVGDGTGTSGALQLIRDAEINVNYAYGGASTWVVGVDDALRASTLTGI